MTPRAQSGFDDRAVSLGSPSVGGDMAFVSSAARNDEAPLETPIRGEGGQAVDVGVARRDVSPPIGVDLCGFIAREGPNTGIHDPLYATALVASDAARSVALTVCDLIGLGARTVARLRAAVEARTGIPAAAQMYACTHTHGGPDTGVITTTGAADPGYLARLETTIVEAVVEARARMAPARIGWQRGTCDAAFNRRQPPGAVWSVDPDLLVARIERLDGSPMAALLHYTCHPTASGPGVRLVTSDWCGVARGVLERAGAGTVLAVNGAAGDVNAKMETRGLAAAEGAGRRIGDAALELWQAADVTDAHAIGASSAHVPLTLGPLPERPELVRLWDAWQRTMRTERPGTVAYRGAMVTHRDYVQKLTRLTYGSDLLPEIAVETQALRLGPVIVASLPGEFFNAYGRQVKAAAPDRPVMVAGWTNDNVGYFPTRDQYPHGGYEVDVAYKYYGFPSAWTAESGEAVTAEATTLVRELLSRSGG